jgi:hypothetical protein
MAACAMSGPRPPRIDRPNHGATTGRRRGSPRGKKQNWAGKTPAPFLLTVRTLSGWCRPHCGACWCRLQRRYQPPVMVLQAWPVGDRPSSPSPAGRIVHSEIARRLAAGGISPVSRAFLFGTQQRRSDVARVVASICLWTCPRLKPTQARRRRYLVVSGGSKGRHSRTATEVHMGTPPDPKHNGGHEIMLTRSRSAS